jgi:hypothetical protein
MKTKHVRVKAGEKVELHLRGQNKLSLTQTICGPATIAIIEIEREKTTKQRRRKNSTSQNKNVTDN